MATLCLPVTREFLNRMAWQPKLLESLDQSVPLDTIRDVVPQRAARPALFKLEPKR